MNADTLTRQALDAIAIHDTASAIASLERVLEEDPDHAIALINLGSVRLLTKDPVGATGYFERACRVAAAEPDARLGLVKALIGQRRLEEAAEALDPLLDQDLSTRQEADYQHLRGVICSAQQDWPGAAEAFRSAIQCRPQNPLSYFSLYQTFLEQQDTESALAVLEELAALDPSRTQTWFRLLTGLAVAGDWSRFRRWSNEMLAANPGHVVLHNLAARLYLEHGYYAYGFLVYRSLAATQPDFDRSQFTALARLEALA